MVIHYIAQQYEGLQYTLQHLQLIQCNQAGIHIWDFQ